MSRSYLLMGAFAVLVVLGVFLFTGYSSQPGTEPSTTSFSAQQAVSDLTALKASPDEETLWKSYYSRSVGISLKYPDSFRITEMPNADIDTLPIRHSIVITDDVNASDSSNQIPSSDYMQITREEGTADMPESVPQSAQTTFLGHNTLALTGDYNGNAYDLLYFKSGGNLYVISINYTSRNDATRNKLYKILSTLTIP